MEHPTKQKTPNVKAKHLFKRGAYFEKEVVQDNIDSAYSLLRNKRNAEENIKPVEAFDSHHHSPSTAINVRHHHPRSPSTAMNRTNRTNRSNRTARTARTGRTGTARTGMHLEPL